jgi:DNA-binding response OmpR family regulator
MTAPKILVVDDEPSISKVVVSYLRKEGFEVYSAADGSGGLKPPAYRPDLIADIMLPGMDGLEVLTQLRQVNVQRVILLTARLKNWIGCWALHWRR